MNVIWTSNGTFRLYEYGRETDLESAILKVQNELFGMNRIYLDIKKKIGVKGDKRNIPDGYLLDLSSSTPRLFVVENELQNHDVIAHIAVQLLEFSLAFEATPRLVQDVLLDAIASRPDLKIRCEQYIKQNNFRNLDHLLSNVVHGDFAALVIIDQIPDKLVNVLAKKLGFTVEILELARYRSASGETVYMFKPFLEEFDTPLSQENVELPVNNSRNIDQVDTIVVPAHEEGFQNTFLAGSWYAIKMGGLLRSRVKYIAAYRTAPISKITHVAPVKEIIPYEDTDKFAIIFSEAPYEIQHIGRGSRLKHLQNKISTNLEKLLSAKTLDDL